MPNIIPFFHALTQGYAGDELRLEIRPLLPERRKNELDAETVRAAHSGVRNWYTLSPKYLANAAVRCAELANNYDVYFGVLPRNGRSGSQQDVCAASCLFCDIDGGDAGAEGAIALFKASGLPAPHIAVKSGGGAHLYWLLSETILLPDHAARESFKRTLRRLCRKIGGASPGAHADTSACEVARILRVPGTFNHKRETPRPVKLIRLDAEGERLSYDWWRLNLPDEPPTRIDAPRPATYQDGFVSDGLMNWARQGYSEGNRHKDLTGAAAWLVRTCKITKRDAAALMQIKAQNSPGRRAITEREIQEMIEWAG